MPDPEPIASIALISSNGPSLANFRGPLIAALVSSGVRVWALAPDLDDRTRRALREIGAEPVDISLDRAGLRPVRDALDLIRLRKVLRRLRPDAVFGYFIKPVIYGTLAARLAGVPRRFALVPGLGYVFTPQAGRESFRRRALRIAVSRLYALAFASSERIFFHNEDDRDQLVGAGLLPRAKTLLLAGTGVDLSRFDPGPPTAGPLRFLLIARLLREKGVAEYAEAARLVRAANPRIEFHLVGGADPNPGAIPPAQIEQWVAAGLLVWHGHVDDVRPFLRDCCVYVLPSWREGKPRSTQEAMASARAVITTDAPGCRETVIEGVNGFKVPVRDAPALAAAMLRFVDEPHLVARMGAESRRLAEERFDVVEINRRILSALGVRASPAATSADTTPQPRSRTSLAAPC